MPRPVYLETFGCQMNELDSELVAGALAARGYRFVKEPEQAQVVLYNTCSVREHAEQKVWSRLGELAVRKKTEPGLVVGVMGCLAERDGADLVRRMPVVDVLVGPGELDKLPALLDNAVRTRDSMLADATEDDTDVKLAARSAKQVALQGNTSRRTATLSAAEDSLEMLDLSRSISPVDIVSGEEDGGGGTSAFSGIGRKSAYVRITRGCNKFCTYCVVPFTRGAEMHRPPEHIIEECKRLAGAGVIEVTLLGQTVNHYRFEHGASVTLGGVVQPQKGRAFTGGHARDPLAGANVTTFADLLRRIHDEVPEIKRLRFVTSYPRDFGDDVLEVIRDHPRLCRYLHVPAQSGSDRLLKLMNRGYTVAEYLEFIDRANSFLHQPEIGRALTISGDFIVGFPTETDEDFEKTVALVERVRYKNSFIFKYSPRPGTVAYDKIADDVPEAVKRARNARLLGVQTAISDELSRALVGGTYDVFVEGLSKIAAKKERRASVKPKNGTIALTIGGKHSDDDDRGCGGGGGGGGGSHQHEACAVADDENSVLTPSEGPVQLAARTDGDHIVFFESPSGTTPKDWIGRIVPVRVERAQNLALFGELLAKP
ncbi:MAG: MiaB/RimO family radical SAM methylthiotransferase [Tepidisphaera sp.]